MEKLTFDTGIVTYQVNDGAEIRFNPTDTEFAKRIYDIFAELSQMQDQYANMGSIQSLDYTSLETVLNDEEKAEEFQSQTKRLLDAFTQMDADMRSQIDGLFGTGTAEGVFGKLNLYAFADGLPLWANFLLAVLDKFPNAAEQQAQLTDPRLKKYAGKYSAKYRKRS